MPMLLLATNGLLPPPVASRSRSAAAIHIASYTANPRRQHLHRYYRDAHGQRFDSIRHS